MAHSLHRYRLQSSPHLTCLITWFINNGSKLVSLFLNKSESHDQRIDHANTIIIDLCAQPRLNKMNLVQIYPPLH